MIAKLRCGQDRSRSGLRTAANLSSSPISKLKQCPKNTCPRLPTRFFDMEFVVNVFFEDTWGYTRSGKTEGAVFIAFHLMIEKVISWPIDKCRATKARVSQIAECTRLETPGSQSLLRFRAGNFFGVAPPIIGGGKAVLRAIVIDALLPI